MRSVAQITVSANGITAEISVQENGFACKFTQPDTLRRLKVLYDGEEMTAYYGNLETKVPKSFLGEIVPLFDLLTAFKSNDGEQWAENIRLLTLDEREFLLYYDSVSEKITRLEVKGEDGTYTYDVLSYIKQYDETESTGTN